MTDCHEIDQIEFDALFGHIFDVDEFINTENETLVTQVTSESSDKSENTSILGNTRSFASVDVDAFLEQSVNHNTKKKTDRDMKVFKDFLMSKGEQKDPEFIPPDELNLYISEFLLAVRKMDGGEYEPTTLRGFISSIERHLKSKNSKMSVINDIDFNKARMVLKGKQKSLKSQGLGNKPKTAEPLTDEQLEKMYEAGTLGDASPRALIHSLWLICATYFGMRTGQEIHNLCWGDVKLELDDHTGLEYLVLDTERQTKTRTGANPKDTRTLKPKAFAIPENPRSDPVHLYKMYREKRPDGMNTDDSPFFLTPGNFTQICWFRKTPMGINKLYSIMKEMKEDAGIDAPRITPYSARKRLVQKLSDGGVPANQIVQISGHKNVNSLNNYSKLNNQQCRQISDILSSRPSTSTAAVFTPPAETNTHAQPSTSHNSTPRGFFINSHFHGNVNFHFTTSSTLTNTRNETQQLSQVLHNSPVNLHPESPVRPPFKRIRQIIESDSD